MVALEFHGFMDKINYLHEVLFVFGTETAPQGKLLCQVLLIYLFSAVLDIGLDVLLDHLVGMNLENVISQWFLKDQMLENFYSTSRSQIYGVPQSLT